MRAESYRYLAFAFAAADLLLELDAEGCIRFAVGAPGPLASTEAELGGRALSTLFLPDDAALVQALVAGLDTGGRRGAVGVRMVGHDGRPVMASLSLARLPQLGPAISCAISLQPPPIFQERTDLGQEGDLEATAKPVIELARRAGKQLELALVTLAGLDGALASLSESDAEVLRRQASGALRGESWAGAAATRVGRDRFALLREPGESADRLVARLSRVLSVATGGAAIQASASVSAVPMDEDLGAAMRLIRHAVDSYLTDAAESEAEVTGEHLGRAVKATLAEAGALGALIADRRFKLLFQPIVSLADRELSHYETLVRFPGGRSPYALIRMAEELDMIERLDIAVAEEAIRHLQADPTGTLRLSVNVSGRSVTRERWFRTLIGRSKDLAGRLSIEITESAAIEDLDRAAAHVRALRQRGFEVCLDDFGAGAASMDYLRALQVDVVKIDGRYIKELGVSSRNVALVRHMVDLCTELRVRTIAEMVETEDTESALRAMGVTYGQGWLFGRPSELPEANRAPVAPPRRRVANGDEWR